MSNVSKFTDDIINDLSANAKNEVFLYKSESFLKD